VLGKESRPKVEVKASAGSASAAAMLRTAKGRFPDARLRRISFPREAGGPVLVRMRQPEEWTPNGRTQLAFDSRSGALLSIEDPLLGNRSAALAEKLYPIHSAKAGGLLMKLLMTLSGLGLFILGSLATYGFWWRRWTKRRSGARRAAISAPASA
jgi:uncharacterized iron-regulated membrane protein